MDAASNAAMACFCYLESSLELVDPRVSDQQLIEHIAKGFHAFHRYAMAYWLSHIESAARLCRTIAKESLSDLLLHPVMFCERHEDACRRIDPPKEILDYDDKANQHLRAFQPFPKLHAFVSTYGNYKRAAENESNQGQEGKIF